MARYNYNPYYRNSKYADYYQQDNDDNGNCDCSDHDQDCSYNGRYDKYIDYDY